MYLWLCQSIGEHDMHLRVHSWMVFGVEQKLLQLYTQWNGLLQTELYFGEWSATSGQSHKSYATRSGDSSVPRRHCDRHFDKYAALIWSHHNSLAWLETKRHTAHGWRRNVDSMSHHTNDFVWVQIWRCRSWHTFLACTQVIPYFVNKLFSDWVYGFNKFRSAGQRSDGLFGPIIIRESNDVNAKLYDVDSKDHVVVVHDWMNQIIISKVTKIFKSTKEVWETLKTYKLFLN